MLTDHTPTPWEVYQPRKHVHVRAADGTYIIESSTRGFPTIDDAAYIVRCVNEREALLRALRNLIRDWEASFKTYGPMPANMSEQWPHGPHINWQSFHDAQAILTQADEKGAAHAAR